MASEPRIIGESAATTEPGGLTPAAVAGNEAAIVREVGGREGPEPTRYGDWEKNGRCIDF